MIKLRNCNDDFVQLGHHLSSLVNVLPEEISMLADLLEIREYKKKEQILYDINEAKGYFYIIKGFCRVYEIKENQEKTYAFTGPGDFTTNINSVIYGGPSYSRVQALTEIRGIFISFKNAKWAAHNLQEGEQLVRKLYEKYCIIKTKEILSHYHTDLLSRYEELLLRFPDITQCIPQKIIASYLNCSPQHLSALKAKTRKS